jgi:hypothetical protein
MLTGSFPTGYRLFHIPLPHPLDQIYEVALYSSDLPALHDRSSSTPLCVQWSIIGHHSLVTRIIESVHLSILHIACLGGGEVECVLALSRLSVLGLVAQSRLAVYS